MALPLQIGIGTLNITVKARLGARGAQLFSLGWMTVSRPRVLLPFFGNQCQVEIIENREPNRGNFAVPLNITGSLAIGLDLKACHPLSGPIMLVPVEEDLHAQRQAQKHFFGRLDALALGLSSE